LKYNKKISDSVYDLKSKIRFTDDSLD